MLLQQAGGELTRTHPPRIINIAGIVVKGDMGHQDAEVVARIMSHVCQATGLNITQAVDPENPKAGEYIHLATRDAAAPAGRMRVLLPGVDEVRRLYAALHGQALLVNGDYIAIAVENDLIRIDTASGNDPRARR